MYSEQELTIDQEISQVKDGIAVLTEMAKKRKQFERLLENEDFKEIILEGFLKQYTLEQVSLLTNHEFQSPEKRATLQRTIEGTAVLGDYLDSYLMMSATVEQELEDAKKVLEELVQESQEQAE